MADTVDAFVEHFVKLLAHGLVGRISNDADMIQAEHELDAARGDLAAFTEGSKGFTAEAIRNRLTELSGNLDAAQAQVDQLRVNSHALGQINTLRDWGALTVEDKRTLIKAFFEEITIVPATEAKGTDRIKWKLRMHADADVMLPEARADAQRALDQAARHQST